MKLSEAIRLNGMMKPQGRGYKSIVSRDAPCALGGALQSIGRQPDPTLANGDNGDREAYRILVEEWPWIEHISVCPCRRPHYHCVSPVLSVVGIIVTLNDLHGWSRAEIADWVEPDCDRIRRNLPFLGRQFSVEQVVDRQLGSFELPRRLNAFV